MNKKTLVLCLFLASVCQAQTAKPHHEELFTTLQKSAWEPKSMQALQALMRNEREPAALRSRAMALCTLALLRQGNTNQFVRAVQLLEATYPEGKGLVTVSVSQNREACSACGGKGTREVNCPACKGSACPRCKGTRILQTVCSVCMGSTQQFKLSPAVQENYARLLAESLEICQQDVRFEKQSALALAEQDNDKRIALLESLVTDFPKRTDLAQAKKSLEDARKTRDAALARKQEQEKREKEEATVERLRGLRQATSENQASAIREIEDFLLKNPKCFARAELEELKNELTAKVNFRSRLVSAVTWLGGICLACVVGVFLKVFLMPKRVERMAPLPGMDRIDKSKFTDPLADEREKAEAHRRRGEL